MGDVINVKLCDELKMKGIMCKGFGLISKYTMLDRDLSLTAKSIYAFLCSMAGNGNTAFPGRDTITYYLGINKETFYTHFKQLTDQGYISVQKQVAERGRFAHNLYCIESNPKKFAEETQQTNGGTLYGSLAYCGLTSSGYGMIPKAVMYDERLSAKAKGLYAYFASFTGSGKVAFPKQENIIYHLHISKDLYYKCLKELVGHNYITVVQRFVNGRRGVNDYYLSDKPGSVAESTVPQEVEQLPVFPDTVKPDTEKQDAVKQDTEKQPEEKQDTGKQDTKEQPEAKPDTIINSSPSTNLKNNSLNKINHINPTQSVPLQQGEMDEMDSVQEEDLLKQRKAAKWRKYLRTYYSQSREELKQDLEANLGYEDFQFTGIPPNIASLNSLVEIILDAVCSKGDTIKISGEVLDKYEVAQVLFSLTIDHLNYVLDCVTNTSSNIKNIKAYYLKSLYEAPKSYELYELKMVNELDQARYL